MVFLMYFLSGVRKERKMRKSKPKSVDTRDCVKVVTKNNFITAIGHEKLSLKAKKLLYIAISQVRQNDKEFYEFCITPIEFADMMGIAVTHVYQEIESITDELSRLALRCQVDEDTVRKYSTFSFIEYGSNCDIKFKLNPDMTDFLLLLQRDFTQLLTNDVIKMKSNYSIAVWHLMQKEMKSKKPFSNTDIEFDLSLEELREATGTEDKFKQLVQFKEKVLDKAIREIYDCCYVDIQYTNIKKSRTVVGFHFVAKDWQYSDKGITDRMLKASH